MIVSIVKVSRKQSCFFCINTNKTLERHTEIFETDKIGANKSSGTIAEQNDTENPKLLLSQTEIEKLEKSKTGKQFQSNLIKIPKEKIMTIAQYEKKNSNHKLALKKSKNVNKGNY